MELGVFAKIFSRGSIEGVLDAVALHGIRCIQFNFACVGLPSMPSEIELGVLEHVRDTAAARKIAISAVSGTCNMIHPDSSQRTESLQRLRVIISACHHIGANLITLCTGTRDAENMWRAHPDNALPSAWRDLTASIEEVLEVAEVHGVTLGIEPETNNVVNSAAKARKLLDEIASPNLKIILDAANLFHPGETPRMKEILTEAFDLLGRDIVLAHAKDLDRDCQAGNLTLGQGVLDWDYYLALLRQSSSSVPLIMHGFGEFEVKASAAFMLGKFGTIPST